jgi:hypothetical protein
MFLVCFLFVSNSAGAAVLQFGDQDVLGNGSYSTDPTAGATLEGLAPGVSTFGAPGIVHNFPFAPSTGDYPGTDQIYVGTVQTDAHEGYSAAAQRINGPQVITMDYSSLVPAGQVVQSLTLGIAADDFQFPRFGNPFTAQINGVTDSSLTDVINSVDETGPVVQFFSIGILPGELLSTNVLTLSINEGGDGGDGWAIDFLTVGVTAVPEPATLYSGLCSLLCVAFVAANYRRNTLQKRLNQ